MVCAPLNVIINCTWFLIHPGLYFFMYTVEEIKSTSHSMFENWTNHLFNQTNKQTQKQNFIAPLPYVWLWAQRRKHKNEWDLAGSQNLEKERQLTGLSGTLGWALCYGGPANPGLRRSENALWRKSPEMTPELMNRSSPGTGGCMCVLGNH